MQSLLFHVLLGLAILFHMGSPVRTQVVTPFNSQKILVSQHPLIVLQNMTIYQDGIGYYIEGNIINKGQVSEYIDSITFEVYYQNRRSYYGSVAIPTGQLFPGQVIHLKQLISILSRFNGVPAHQLDLQIVAVWRDASQSRQQVNWTTPN